MAGDWVAMRLDLADDPAVIAIASEIGLDEYAVVGRLHSLWSWANRHLVDGNASTVTDAWIDRFLRTPGFAAAMHNAGWLHARSSGLEFPKFNRWNSQTAKARLLTAKRVQDYRNNGNAQSNGNANGNVTLPPLPTGEERRVEKNKEKTEDSFASDDAKPPADSFLEFPTSGTPQTWHLTRSQIAAWEKLYPGIDVTGECRKAFAWIAVNTKKTAKGMPRFLVTWLNRTTNAPQKPSYNAPPKPQKTTVIYDELPGVNR